MAKKHATSRQKKKAIVQQPLAVPEVPINTAATPVEITPKKSSKRFLGWIKTHKTRSILVSILFVILVLSAVPVTRNTLSGIFIKKELSFVVQDAKSHSHISDADVLIDGKLFSSDQSGIVKATDISPGTKTVVISKLFYTPLTTKISVSLFTNKQTTFNIDSTGRHAKATIKNRFNGRVLAGIDVKTEQGSHGKTGADGTVQLILPSDKSEVKGTISGDAIVTADVTIRAVQDSSTNVFPATPSGSIFFLSKASGTIDVVKANLDGTDRQTVLAGTGKEDDSGTVMLASKDWKYLALKSRRDSDYPKLYLIETATGKVNVIEDSDATFTLIGWSDSSFIYTVSRFGVNNWQAKRQALKSYSTVSKQLITLDETEGEGTSDIDYASESIQNIFILDEQIVYAKNWIASYYYGTHLANKKMAIMAIKPDGSGKKTLHDWQAGYNTYISSIYAGPSLIYYRVELDGGLRSNWKYENGAISEAIDLTNDDLEKTYPTYLESPNGTSNFWSEARDGKNALFIGDNKGANGKQIADLSEYTPYGWYTNDYLLVSKDQSELYIMGRDGIKPGMVPTKISDYHRANYSFTGYGGL